jgi:hypothetical protein
MSEDSGFYDWSFRFTNGGYKKIRALRMPQFHAVILKIDAHQLTKVIDFSSYGYDRDDFVKMKFSFVHSFISAN